MKDGENIMEVISIIPAIKIVKESGICGCDMYIVFGDNIKVTDINNRIFTGIFLYMDLARNEDDFDLIVLNIGDENVSIQCPNIKDIKKV